MKTWSKKKKILIGLLALFLLAQTIQPQKNNGNPHGPSDLNAAVQVPADVFSVLKRSCYNCHSNYTDYPWYDHITPVNWWISSHIIEGKKDLNFTIFKDYPKPEQFELLEEIAQSVETDEMPLKSYLVAHPKAKLSAAEKMLIATWARKTMDEINRLKAD